MTEINLKQTLNLPQTDFNIRANLAVKEPEILESWKKINFERKDAQKTYVLHDGPPYPNGNIHIGHALNKVLKDIINRFKSMRGFKTKYVPGWDCHGLPIETQVLKELKGEKGEIAQFRKHCHDFALRFVETQKADFIRLGINAEWDNPYLTLNPEYEAGVISLFGDIAKNGLIYKGSKPIHWCTHCETALAEAEIEFAEHRSPSIYVLFKAADMNILVWTTTPWTLPANVAVAAHPDFTYVKIKSAGQVFVVVKELKDSLIEKLGLSDAEVIGEIKGKELAGTVTKHPFLDRESPIVLANYVTKEDGTGFVHIAPGHGQEDHVVGKQYNLPVLMPVDDKGRFTEGEWQGQFVFDANKGIGQKMEELGTLKKLEFIKHSYPHCWRCKNPVIFRATEQWFIAMDKPMPDGKTLREHAMQTIKKTAWYPAWGEKRITGMIENRPDWCISRQRLWGIQLPIFTCKSCGKVEMTGKIVTQCDCGGEFERETDILDVWFESGSSFRSVLGDQPADLYLEGSDQHRGWFQSSMLIGLAAQGHAPFKGILTHGFIVDTDGKKMSKSAGNVTSPQTIIKEYGADVLRWWVAGSDFKNSDVNIAKNILDQARDSFGKVRNTIRFCLSNLYDYEGPVHFDELSELDRWALTQLNRLVERVETSYDQFDFHIVTHSVHDFCAVTLSSLYLDMVKDRLYCDKGKTRQSTQTALYHIADTLIKLLAPILVFTAEDAYHYFPSKNKKESVHLENFPEIKKEWTIPSLETKWEKLLEIKDLVYQKLEKLRAEKIIGSSLEAVVTLTLPEAIPFEEWESLFIVSKVHLKTGNLDAEVKKSEHEKCERCWKRLPLIQNVCDRCDAVVKGIKV